MRIFGTLLLFLYITITYLNTMFVHRHKKPKQSNTKINNRYRRTRAVAQLVERWGRNSKIAGSSWVDEISPHLRCLCFIIIANQWCCNKKLIKQKNYQQLFTYTYLENYKIITYIRYHIKNTYLVTIHQLILPLQKSDLAYKITLISLTIKLTDIVDFFFCKRLFHVGNA